MPVDDTNHNSPGLIGAAVVLSALVAAIGLVIYVGVAPPASHTHRDPLLMGHGAVAKPQAAAGWKARALLPSAGETARRTCLDAIDRAAASQRAPSQAAIAASTDMLRKCNAG